MRRVIQPSEEGGFVDAVSFSWDSNTLAVASSGSIRFVPLGSVGRVHTRPIGRSIEALTFSPDGEFLGVATISREGGVVSRMVSLVSSNPQGENGEETKIGSRITQLAFSADGRYVLYAPLAEGVQVCEKVTLKRVASLKSAGDGGVHALAISRKGERIAFADQAGVHLHGLDGRRIPFPPGEKLGAGPLAFGTDGRTLMGVVRTYPGKINPVKPNAIPIIQVELPRYEVVVWDTVTFAERLRFTMVDTPGLMKRVRIAADLRWIVCAREENLVKIWDMEARKPIYSLAHEGDVEDIQLSPNRKWLASIERGERGSQVRLWELFP